MSREEGRSYLSRKGLKIQRSTSIRILCKRMTLQIAFCWFQKYQIDLWWNCRNRYCLQFSKNWQFFSNLSSNIVPSFPPKKLPKEQFFSRFFLEDCPRKIFFSRFLSKNCRQHFFFFVFSREITKFFPLVFSSKNCPRKHFFLLFRFAKTAWNFPRKFAQKQIFSRFLSKDCPEKIASQFSVQLFSLENLKSRKKPKISLLLCLHKS